MAKETKHGQIILHTKAIITIIKYRGMEFSLELMAVNILVSGKKEINMEKVYLFGQMEEDMKANS